MKSLHKISRRSRALAILALLFLLASAAGLTLVLINTYSLRLEILGESQVTVEVGASYRDAGAEAEYAGSLIRFFDGPVEVTAEGEVDTSRLGTYTVRYRAEKGGKEAEGSRTVRVVDRKEPVIELTVDPEAYTLPGKPYQEEGYKATDNYDGDLTAAVHAEEKEGKVYYSVRDRSGNIGRAVREIVYDDRTAPVLTLGEAPAEIYQEDSWSDSYSSVDDLDGDISDKVEVEGTVDNMQAGSYQLHYTSTDAHGNKAEADRTVTVLPLPQNDPSRAASGSRIVYLTFDDGPGPYTERLLGILAKYNVKATFFVTAQYGYADLIGRESQEGHAVGVHTYSHDYSKIYASSKAFWEDFDAINRLIEEQTGSRSRLMRFPGGSSNMVSSFNKGIMTSLTQEAIEKGYDYYDWNVLSGDAGDTRDSGQIVQNILSGISGRDVSVVLCHDIHSFTVDAMERTVRQAILDGYTFLPLQVGSTVSHHPVNN